MTGLAPGDQHTFKEFFSNKHLNDQEPGDLFSSETTREVHTLSPGCDLQICRPYVTLPLNIRASCANFLQAGVSFQ